MKKSETEKAYERGIKDERNRIREEMRLVACAIMATKPDQYVRDILDSVEIVIEDVGDK